MTCHRPRGRRAGARTAASNQLASRLGAQQLTVLLLHRFIAFARARLKAFNIKDFDFTASVFDHAGLLERFRNRGHAAPSNPEHFSQEFLGERQVIASR